MKIIQTKMLFIEKPDSFVADRIAAGCFFMVENKFLILRRDLE